jgi:hypothetical protein
MAMAHPSVGNITVTFRLTDAVHMRTLRRRRMYLPLPIIRCQIGRLSPIEEATSPPKPVTVPRSEVFLNSQTVRLSALIFRRRLAEVSRHRMVVKEDFSGCRENRGAQPQLQPRSSEPSQHGRGGSQGGGRGPR